jgi:hypothetical protein
MFKAKGKLIVKKPILSDESFKAVSELGEILRGIHNDMIAEGYEIKDGKVVKKI